MKTFPLVIWVAISLCGFSSLYAQNFTLSGSIIDSTKAPLAGATAVLLQAEDSVMKHFSFTGKDGEYEMKNVLAGDYLLQVSYLGYLTYFKSLNVAASVALPPITMTPQDQSLNEVIIEGERTPIFLKKDTIEYNAEAFKVQPNATVEDLLKRLPGVEVEQDGSVKAQGETVQRVTVDGKEFFGNDPKLATQNLPADAVNRIQVFDRQSDLAEFTGIDDGNREKTINLQLKEDRKNGLFGTITAGYGTDNRTENKASVNKFSKKTQLSFLGLYNNTNKQGFSFEDYIGFQGGISAVGRNGGGRNIRRGGNSNSAGVPIGEDLSDGFVTTAASGINWNQDFSKKTRLTFSYFYNSVERDLASELVRQNFLESGNFTYDEVADNENTNQNHRANLRLTHKFDSTQQLILTGNAGYTDGESSSISSSNTFSNEGELENQSATDNQNEGDRWSATAEISYRKKLAKQGRNFVISANANLVDNDRFLNIFNQNQFFDPANEDSLFIQRQEQDQQTDQLNFQTSVSYTEPLGNRTFLEVNLSQRNYNNQVDQEVEDLLDDGANDFIRLFNPFLSNAYESDYNYQQAGMNYRMVRNKLNWTVGVSGQRSRLTGDLPLLNTEIDNTYYFLLPSAQLRIDMGSAKNLFLNYRTRVNEPSIEQLQPVVDNTDPLNVYVGNPDLDPAYTHTLTGRFLSFSQFNFTSLFAFFRLSYTDNSIINATAVDSLFRRTTRPLNVDNTFSALAFGSYSTPIRSLKINLRVNSNLSYNRNIQFLNERETPTNRYILSGGLRLDNRKKDVLDLAIGSNISYTLTTYDDAETADQTFLNQRYYAELGLFLGKKWRVGSQINYRLYEGDGFGEQEAIPIWEASLSHYFLKNNRGEFRLSAYDILNKNIGINQTSDLNYIEEERITSLARYVMFSFVYNLSKFGQDASGLPPGGRMRIFRPR
ncbi:MAG: outer membrane beta-barrel protein [Bacteroidota bacterium]